MKVNKKKNFFLFQLSQLKLDFIIISYPFMHSSKPTLFIYNFFFKVKHGYLINCSNKQSVSHTHAGMNGLTMVEGNLNTFKMVMKTCSNGFEKKVKLNFFIFFIISPPLRCLFAWWVQLSSHLTVVL